MEQMNYVPNAHAQSLSLKKTNTICFTIARNPREILGNSFFSDVLYGISDAAKLQNYNLQFAIFHTFEEQMASCIKLFKKKQVDGFIFTSVLSQDKDELLQNMQKYRIPYVLIGSNMSHNMFSIHNDNIRDSYMATRYLLDKGYRKMLLLVPNLKQDVIYDRVHGYKRAVKEAGLELSHTHIVPCSDDESDLNRTLDELRERGVSFDSIMTMDSITSLSALKYCQTNGLRVPEEVGILCFNNAPFLDKVSPSVSCVDPNPHLLGSEAFKMLMDLIDPPPGSVVNKSILLPSTILERQSTQKGQLTGAP